MTGDQLVNVGASGFMAVCSLVFIVTYHVHAPWRRSAVGRHLMAVAASIGALGLYTVLIGAWPTGTTALVLRILRTTVLLLIAALMLQRARMVIRAQRDRKAAQPRDPPSRL